MAETSTRQAAANAGALNFYLQTRARSLDLITGLRPEDMVVQSMEDASPTKWHLATWLAAQGHEVVAVEPSAGMRAEASRHHPGAGVRWISDALPELATVTRWVSHSI